MSKAKVLHIITRLAVGGAQDNTLITVAKSDRHRYTVELASNPEGIWSDRALVVADKFHPIPHLINPVNPSQDFQALTEIVKLLKQKKFDIVHTHSSKAGILGRIAAKIVQVPVIVHTIHGFAFNDSMPFWQQQMYINLERVMSPFTNYFITVSELNRQQAAKLGILSLENSKTIYSGIDFEKLDSQTNLEETKQELNIHPEWKVILMVGRLDPQKAVHFLIKAFTEVVKQQPQTLLLLVGEGELQSQLENQAQELGIADKVRFLGVREDVPDIIKIADIFALSSLWEGLGRAMTEAMLLGKPVVVPNIYGIPEIVKHQDTGLLFAAGNTEELAQHLLYLLENQEECQRLGDNAKKLTRKLFDANNMVWEIDQLYEDLLRNKKPFSAGLSSK